MIKFLKWIFGPTETSKIKTKEPAIIFGTWNVETGESFEGYMSGNKMRYKRNKNGDSTGTRTQN